MDKKNQEIRYLFGKRLKAARKAKGLSQGKLGDMIGGGQNTISNYENGQSFPNPSTVESLIEVLGITRNQLFDNINYSDNKISSNVVLEEPDQVEYSNPHKDILSYLDYLEKNRDVDLETLTRLKTYVLKMYEEIVSQHKKYDDLRELVKKELNLPI